MFVSLVCLGIDVLEVSIKEEGAKKIPRHCELS